jgi:hypothetical protein
MLYDFNSRTYFLRTTAPAGNSASTPGSFLQRSGEVSFAAWALGSRRAYAGANPANRGPGGENVDGPKEGEKSPGTKTEPAKKACPSATELKAWADLVKSDDAEAGTKGDPTYAVGCGTCGGNVAWFVARSSPAGSDLVEVITPAGLKKLAEEVLGPNDADSGDGKGDRLYESRGRCHAEVNVVQAMEVYGCTGRVLGISQRACPECHTFLGEKSVTFDPASAGPGSTAGAPGCRGTKDEWRKADKHGDTNGPGGRARLHLKVADTAKPW